MLEHQKITNLIDLEDYLQRTCIAFRKSYKLLSRVQNVLTIAGGTMSMLALLVAIPVMPVGLVVLSVGPIIIIIIQKTFKMDKNIKILKQQYQNYRELLLFTRINAYTDEKTLIKEVFIKSLKLQKEAEFKTPLEYYIKKYRLNGYNKV